MTLQCHCNVISVQNINVCRCLILKKIASGTAVSWRCHCSANFFANEANLLSCDEAHAWECHQSVIPMRNARLSLGQPMVMALLPSTNRRREAE
jgi:hypothetical protein